MSCCCCHSVAACFLARNSTAMSGEKYKKYTTATATTRISDVAMYVWAVLLTMMLTLTLMTVAVSATAPTTATHGGMSGTQIIKKTKKWIASEPASEKQANSINWQSDKQICTVNSIRHTHTPTIERQLTGQTDMRVNSRRKRGTPTVALGARRAVCSAGGAACQLGMCK